MVSPLWLNTRSKFENSAEIFSYFWHSLSEPNRECCSYWICHYKLTSMSTSSSSSSSSLSEQARQDDSIQDASRGHSNIMTENSYSRHSAWVHPAIAFQNQYLTNTPNQIPAISLRKGKWCEEEEFYTKKLIDAFNGGYLKVSSGTTLRSFLAERLCWWVLILNLTSNLNTIWNSNSISKPLVSGPHQFIFISLWCYERKVLGWY